MKKIVLFALMVAFGLNVMAQETKSESKAKVTPTKEVVKSPGGENKVVVNQPTQATAGQPNPDEIIKVNVEKHDFGKIKQGNPVTFAFEIKNVSKKAVVVENTYSSCGCTTPDKIVEPIAPGATVK